MEITLAAKTEAQRAPAEDVSHTFTLAEVGGEKW